MTNTRCPKCRTPVREFLIDDTDEVVLADPRSVYVVIQIPDMIGHVTTIGNQVHICKSKLNNT